MTPTGERYQLFGEGGGQLLAEELEVPLLGKVPLTIGLREQSDAGLPIVASDPDDPAAQALGHAARGLIALSPIELPVMQAPAPAAAPKPVGMSLPMALAIGPGFAWHPWGQHAGHPCPAAANAHPLFA